MGIFGRHEVLVAKSEWECLAGLELFESVGVGICGAIGLNVEIIGQDVDDLADRAMSVSIRISWIQIDPDRLAWNVGVRCWLGDVFHYYRVGSMWRISLSPSFTEAKSAQRRFSSLHLTNTNT